MKHYLVIVVSLAFIAQSNCGLIDGFRGIVKDTTSSITHNVGGALHYGKNLIFGGSEQNEAGQIVIKPGIVGTVSRKIHDVSETVREGVRSVLYIFDGDQVHDKGIIGRLFDRVKSRVFKIKSYLFGDGNGLIQNRPIFPIKIKPFNNDTTALSQKLRKYIFKGASNSGIKQTLNSLQEAINRASQNITKKKPESDNENAEHDGIGVLDIRLANDLAGDLQNSFENGVDAGYDKVNDAIDEGRQTVQSSLSNAQRSTSNFIENQRINIQDQYNKFGDNAVKLKSDVNSTINENIESQRRNALNNYDLIGNNADTNKSDVANTINKPEMLIV